MCEIPFPAQELYGVQCDHHNAVYREFPDSKGRHPEMHTNQVQPILISTPEYFRSVILEFIQSNHLKTIIVESPQEAIHTVITTKLRGVILDGEWNDIQGDLKPTIIDLAQNKKLSTVTLIRKVRVIFDHVYHPPLHQFVTIPFGIDELEVMMRRASII